MKLSQHFISILFIALFSLALYANTLKNGFVYDDEYTVVNNALIKDIANLTKIFDKEAYFSGSGEETYRPVVTLTYFIDYALFGLEAWGYHLTNILLHTINVILAYLFLQLIQQPSSLNRQKPTPVRLFNNLPLMASLLFLTHPLLTEAVNAISFREDLLVFLFYMGAMITYMLIRSSNISWKDNKQMIILLYTLSTLFYLFALFSKEMALTLPVIILGYEWLFVEKKGKGKILPNWYILGYTTITFIYLYIRFYVFNKPVEGTAWTLAERVLTAPWLISKYLLLLLAPFNLSAEYIITPIKSTYSPFFILSFIALLSISALILTMRERNILLGAFFFFVSLIPVYNLWPLDNPFAERYIYLPLLGFIIVVVSVIGKRKTVDGHAALTAGVRFSFLIILIIFSFATLKRNTVWKDNKSLWTDTVKKTPTSSRVHNNLGMVYAHEGHLNEAIKEYLTALKLEPYHPNAHYNLGNAYTRQGRLDEAVTEYLIALNVKPNYASAHHDLGFVYANLSRQDEAIKEYLKALKLKPDYPNAHRNLGIAYSRQGRFDEAIQAFLYALKLKPDDIIARYTLGRIYMKIGLNNEAQREFEIIIRQSPGFVEARKALEAINGK